MIASVTDDLCRSLFKSETDVSQCPIAFHTTGAIHDATSGVDAAFVTKMNPTGTALVYSAELGAGTGTAIAVDSSNNA